MKKRTVLAALAAIAAAALVLPASPAQAQDDTALYIVHGLQVGLPDDDLVTVCAGDVPLFEFTYGEVEDLVVPQTPVDITVWDGLNPGCEDEIEPLIDVPGFTPQGAAQVVVATFVEESELGLAVFGINADCNDAGEGGLTALHASDLVPPVFPAIDGQVLPEPLEFGDELFAALPVGAYDLGLFADPGDEVPADELEVTVAEGVNTVLAAVGNFGEQTLAIIEFPVPVGVCETPDDPNGDEPDDDDDDPQGPTPIADSPTPVPAAERPLALTG